MDTAKVIVKRTTTEPENAVTAFTYTNAEGSTTTMICDAGQDRFAMTPDEAAGAVATGCFEVAEESKSETQEE